MSAGQVVDVSTSGDLGGVADDLARASLAMARRYNVAGATLWCASRQWPFHAHHVAVEFVHPVIVGKRALAALTVPTGADLVATLRASVRPGDMVLALAPAHDAAVVEVMRRGPAWGVETIWVGHGERPAAGSAGAPASHWSSRVPPVGSRGVWHSPQWPGPSTR